MTLRKSKEVVIIFKSIGMLILSFVNSGHSI